MACSSILERNERGDTGLQFWMSVVSRVGFLRTGFILAVLKDAGTMAEVREELKSAVRNVRMSFETAWRREEGIVSRGQVVAWLCYYSVGGERDKLGKDRGGDWRRENGGRDKRGTNVLHFLGKVVNKVISSEAGRRWG